MADSSVTGLCRLTTHIVYPVTVRETCLSLEEVVLSIITHTTINVFLITAKLPETTLKAYWQEDLHNMRVYMYVELKTLWQKDVDVTWSSFFFSHNIFKNHYLQMHIYKVVCNSHLYLHPFPQIVDFDASATNNVLITL